MARNMELVDAVEVVLCQLAALRHFVVLCGDSGTDQVKTGLGYLFDHVERDITEIANVDNKEHCHL